MKEEYQPETETGAGAGESQWETLTGEAEMQGDVTQWSDLAQMPGFAEHEAAQRAEQTELTDELRSEISNVVDRALEERAEQGVSADTAESDLAATMELKCDILDEEWEPEFDRHVQRLSQREQYERNQRDLEMIKLWLKMPEEQRFNLTSMMKATLSAMQDDVREYRAVAAEGGVEPEEIPGYNALYENACDRRREMQLLLTDPEKKQRALTLQQKQLGRELAKNDPRYHDALEGMDPEIIDQNIDAILDSTPTRDFDKLAKLMRDPKKWSAFQKETKEVLVRALELDNVKIDVRIWEGGPDEKSEGYCEPTSDGYIVWINSTMVGQDAKEFADTMAHEFYHILQGQVGKAGGTEMADIYDFNDKHYAYSEDMGYKAYRDQIKEAEAFRFGARFWAEIQKGDVRNQQTLAGRIRHWWQERDTEKMPDRGSAAAEAMPGLGAALAKAEEEKSEERES